jgi:mRNA interferase MazF
MRGDLVTIVLAGDFGKPRPALVIQANQFDEHTTVTLLLMSGTLVDAPLLRVSVVPDAGNRLRKKSQVMIDKTMTIKREKIGPAFGHIDPNTLVEIDRCLAVFLGIAK